MSLLTIFCARPSTIAVLPTPGLADQHRVVLRAPAEDLHDALELAGAPDHRIELLLAGELRQVATELVEDLAVALVAGRIVLGASAVDDAAEPRPCPGRPGSPRGAG
jgi:hypothetical protein